MTYIPTALATQYAADGSTLATCLHVTRQDGAIVRITSADRPIVLSGTSTPSGIDVSGTYDAKPGLAIKAIVSGAGLAVDNTELDVLADEQYIVAQDIVTGLWDQAKFVVFECNYANPSDGIRVLKRGTTGNVQITRGMHVIEFRGLTQALQQTVSVPASKTCRNRFGLNDGRRSFCPIDLADWTESVNVTAVASRLVFTTDSAQPDDWSGNGEALFTSGANDGYRRKIKSLIAGVVTLAEAAPFAIVNGDTIDHIAGCRLRRNEDCRDKFNVVLDFNGEPDLTGTDLVTAPISGDE